MALTNEKENNIKQIMYEKQIKTYIRKSTF